MFFLNFRTIADTVGCKPNAGLEAQAVDSTCQPLHPVRELVIPLPIRIGTLVAAVDLNVLHPELLQLAGHELGVANDPLFADELVRKEPVAPTINNWI